MPSTLNEPLCTLAITKAERGGEGHQYDGTASGRRPVLSTRRHHCAGRIAVPALFLFKLAPLIGQLLALLLQIGSQETLVGLNSAVILCQPSAFDFQLLGQS